MNANTALQQYQQVGAQRALDASPHRLIQMLMDGAIERTMAAKHSIERGDVAAKGEQIGKAINIVAGLRSALDLERGGEIAENLDRLYEYMNLRLLDATANNDTDGLDEVAGLMREVKAGWDGIAEQVEAAG